MKPPIKFKEIRRELMRFFATPTRRAGHDGFRANTAARISSAQGFGRLRTWGFGRYFRSFLRRQCRRRPQAPEKGTTLQINVSLTLEEAAFGCEKEVTVVPAASYCSECSGYRSKTGSQPERCSAVTAADN